MRTCHLFRLAFIRIAAAFGLISSFSIIASASALDSLRLEMGTSVTLGNKDFQPLWIVSNRYGVISDSRTDASTNIRLSNAHNIRLGSRGDSSNLQLSYAVNVHNNKEFGNTFLSEAYSKIKYKGLELIGGRYRFTTGEMDPYLSSGSFGISSNALPIPKISLSVPDYITLPFTSGFVKFKGTLSHGWMGDSQFLKKSYLHEKSFYAKFGKSRFKVFAGLQHFGVWGGQRGDFKLDRSFSGFLDVLLVKEANDGSLDTAIYPGKRPNRAGDQRGLIEYGVEWESDKNVYKIYNQTPFESGKGIDIRNIDRLLGVSVNFKDEKKVLKKIVFEFIYTKQMEDFGSRERQSYYNNGVYRNGWEYHRRIIGTPLFTNRARASEFTSLSKPYSEPEDYNLIGNTNIINNRIIGGHLGLDYKISSGLGFRSLVTLTKNYGALIKEVAVKGNQAYFLQELQANLYRGLDLNVSIGYDTGQLYNNFGTLIGVRYVFFKR